MSSISILRILKIESYKKQESVEGKFVTYTSNKENLDIVIGKCDDIGCVIGGGTIEQASFPYKVCVHMKVYLLLKLRIFPLSSI